MGLTGVHDFDGRRCFMALQSLRRSGELKLRVLKGIPLPDLPYAVGLGLRSGFGDDLLRIGGVKAFMDGALGPQTAAMIQPYEGRDRRLNQRACSSWTPSSSSSMAGRRRRTGCPWRCTPSATGPTTRLAGVRAPAPIRARDRA